MSDFSFLSQYLLPSTEESIRNEYRDNKHFLFSTDDSIIYATESKLKIPLELREFYSQIGYGFFFQKEVLSNDTLLNPNSFKIINLREEYYEFDPDLDLYETEGYKDKLIFFEVNEGVYLLIAKEANDGKNAIYYFDEKIADSLEGFLIRFDQEGHYFENE